KQRGFADHKNIQRNFLFTDYFISPNQYTYEKLLKSHDVYTLFNGAILDIGYPRVDLMFGVNKEMVRNRLGIDDDKQVILYDATLRGTLGNKDNQSQKILDDLKEMQEKCQNVTVLVKAHYYSQEFFKKQGEGHLLVPNTIDTNEVLSVIDILITDYSSVFLDRKSTRLNSSHVSISYAAFCLKTK